MAKSDNKKWALGALFAALAGFVTGILTAPKSGKDTRDDIKTAAAAGKREVELQLKNIHTELAELLDKAELLKDSKTKEVKKEVKTAVDKVTVAQSRVRELLSALHEGNADDPELSKALKEAAAARDHLKKFLKKD